MKVGISDIHKRLRYLPESTVLGPRSNYFTSRVNGVLEHGSANDIINCIELCLKDMTNSVRLDNILELYDALAAKGTESQIRSVGITICNEAVPKVRDAKETQTYLRKKLGHIKGKTTSIGNTVQSNLDDIMDNINKLKSKATENFKTNTGKIKQNVKKGLPVNKNKKKEAVEEAYERMLENCTLMLHCDRILENYNRISKRFNLDKVIQENTMINGIEDTVVRVCELVETYDMPEKVKYNTVLESMWYGFHKNLIVEDYSQAIPKMVTTATDYFMAKGRNHNMCASLLEASMVVDKDDYIGSDMEVITEEEPEEDDEPVIDHEFREFATNYSGHVFVLRESDFNKIFADFKAKDEENKENKLSMLVHKLYQNNVDNIVEGTPNLLVFLRVVLLVTATSINPILGAVSLIVNLFLKLHYNRKDTEAMRRCFKKEIEATKKKIESTNDEEKKKKLEEYLKTVQDSYKKIDEYYESLLNDEELDAKYDSDSDDDFDMGDLKDIAGDDFDDEFDFGDDDFKDEDFDKIDEALKFVPAVSKLISIRENTPIQSIDKTTCAKIFSLAPYTIEEFTDIAKEYPEIISFDSIVEAVNDLNSSTSTNLKTTDKYILNSYSEECRKLSISKTERPTGDIFTEAKRLAIGNEILASLNDITSTCIYYNPMIEASFGNSIALASEKIKKGLQKLSDKDKTISKNIDVTANNFKKAAEKSLTNDNRESVIKGSILPSASKVVKAGILAASTAILLDPIIAVIGVLGWLGASAKYKAKERQMVIDELEIELKMCEKYIQIAEDKNDMKALRKLLTIQKQLESQRQRVKYKMKVEHGQKYHDAEETLADMK